MNGYSNPNNIRVFINFVYGIVTSSSANDNTGKLCDCMHACGRSRFLAAAPLIARQTCKHFCGFDRLIEVKEKQNAFRAVTIVTVYRYFK